MSKVILGNFRRARELLRTFSRDEAGSYLIITSLLMPVLLGAVGLATDYSLYNTTHRGMQSAADSSAFSGAVAYNAGTINAITTQALAVSSSYGFVNGQSNTVVTVNRPPKSGNYTSRQGAVEVIIQQPQKRFFSSVLTSDKADIAARSVGLGTGDGKGCVLSLNKTKSGATTGQGSAIVNLKACSLYDNSADAAALVVGGSSKLTAYSVNVVGGVSGQASITSTQGIATGVPPSADPYGDIVNPTASGPLTNNCCSHNSQTLDPGVYKNGMKLVAGANITLKPGTYYLQGGLDVAGGATLTGTGVTLVFTSSNGSNYASATINGGATVDLSAPTSGAYAGIAMFGDRNMPVGTNFTFNGGSGQNITGALYLPKADLKYAGGADSANGCTQIVADTVTFTGNSNLAVNCTGKGTKPLSVPTVALVE